MQFNDNVNTLQYYERAYILEIFQAGYITKIYWIYLQKIPTLL